MSALDREAWGRLLAQLDEPPLGTVAEALADARGLEIGAAYDAVEAAVDDGPLVETDTGAAFDTVRLDEEEDETPETPEPGDIEARGADSPDDDPQGEAVETPLDDGRAVVKGEAYPETIVDREYWVNWILDGAGRKRPVAPWETGHAYPVKWKSDLPEEERPEADFATAKRWADFDLGDADLQLPDDAQSDGLDTGLLLPNDRPDREECITLIDWDDVRDPDTEEIHPVAADYIQRFGGYVEVSTSGEGLHQFVLGRLRKRGKFIAPIDAEPFVGDDRPQVEIYDGGRHVAMTGRHVAGTDDDVLDDGQPLIDELVTEYADAEKDAGHRRYDPETGEADGDADGSADHVPDPEEGEYTGPTAEGLRETKPDDRSLLYHVAVETFYRGGGNSDGYANIQNWRLEGFAAALGERDDLGPEAVKADLGGRYLDDTDVAKRCEHRTPERVDYGYNRATNGDLEAPSAATLVEYGVLPPTFVEDDDAGDEHTEDDRDLLGLDVVVEPGDAMRAARAVTPDDLDKPLPELERDDVDDVAIAVALADGVIDSPDVFPRDDGYTEAYYRARDVFGAPLPKYLDNSTLTERFDLVKAALDRVGPEHILDTLRSTITVEDPPSQAIAKIDPAWEESESGERIVAGYGSGFWCTEHDVSFTPLQLVALEHGIIDAEDDYPTGEGYKRAYRLLREEYGAPIPRWRANVFEEVGVLPPTVRVVDDDLSARDTFSLDEARNRTEELVRDAITTTDRAQLVTVIPGGGKTFSTAIVADDEPVLYTPPRNELKKQMEEYAREIRESDEFDAEPTAYHLPILAENRIPEVGINAGVAAVRGDEAALQDREALRETVADQLEAVDEADAEADEDDAVDLDRATCPAAEGDYGEAWRTAVQVAHALGFNPATIHRNARTLFGEALPCCDGGACAYTEGWDVVREPGACPDILIGSAGHAHVDSATSYYREDDSGQTVTDPRAVVVDEFPSDTYATEYGERYMDHAVWLAEALAGVENREELLDADLNTDTWVSLWLRGEADDHVAAGEAIDALRAGADLLSAVEAAEDLLDRDPIALASGATSANLRGVVDVLERLTDGGLGVDDTDAIADVLGSAAEVISGDADRAYADGREEAGRLYGLADTLREDILQPLDAAAAELGDDSLADAIADRTAGLPIAGDLRQLVDDAVAAAEGDAPRELVEAAADALQGGRDGCRALAVGADGGYAHPDAWALLAGAIAEPDDDGVSVGTQRTLSLGDGGEGLQHKSLTVNGADIHADRDHHGAVVFDRPSFTDRDGGTCPLVGLDATARRDLWRIALGRDAEVRDIHDSAAERRRHIREGMNHTVVQTANTPLPYHGDPSGRNFQEDLAVVRAAAEEYTGPGGLDDKAPAVISTKKVLHYLDEELDDVAEETVNYENMKGSDALGSHQVLAILGSQHYGDTEPERWAMYAGQSADRGDTGGDTLDYGSDVANTYLKHMREDHTMQAILRAGRNDDRSVVVAHTSALRDDLPVVAEGATVSAHSKGALAVAEAAADLNDRSFTAADVADRIRDDDRGVGLRQVQNILADLRSGGYLQVESEGSRGRKYEYGVDEDPGLADVELPDPSAVTDGEGKTKSGLLDTYSWYFVLDGEADVGEGILPPSTPMIPATDTAETLVEGDPPR
jgi:hypothetical protein